MGKSLIQVANQSTQAVAVNSIIGLGTVQRRYGCGLNLSGNDIEVTGEGYFTIDADVTVSPTAVGTVTVGLYADGVQIPGAVANGSVSTASNPVTLPITATIRQRCCSNPSTLTLVLVNGAGDVQNVSMRVVKE